MEHCTFTVKIQRVWRVLSKTRLKNNRRSSAQLHCWHNQTENQPGPHTLHDLSKMERIECMLDFFRPFSPAAFLKAGYMHAGPLNCCKVSSHTHTTLLSHWVQGFFCNLHRAWLLIGFSLDTTHNLVGCQHDKSLSFDHWSSLKGHRQLPWLPFGQSLTDGEQTEWTTSQATHELFVASFAKAKLHSNLCSKSAVFIWCVIVQLASFQIKRNYW